MGESLFWIEKGILVMGILFVLTAIVSYGKRSHDWVGVAKMFYQRIPLNISEFKRYRLGVGLVVLAVVLRIITLTLYP